MQSAQTPLTTSGRFCRRIRPERLRNASVFPGQRNRSRITPAENHPEVRNHGKIGAHFLQNRPEVAGARPRAKSRKPSTQTRTRTQPATLPRRSRQHPLPFGALMLPWPGYDPPGKFFYRDSDRAGLPRSSLQRIVGTRGRKRHEEQPHGR